MRVRRNNTTFANFVLKRFWLEKELCRTELPTEWRASVTTKFLVEIFGNMGHMRVDFSVIFVVWSSDAVRDSRLASVWLALAVGTTCMSLESSETVTACGDAEGKLW